MQKQNSCTFYEMLFKFQTLLKINFNKVCPVLVTSPSDGLKTGNPPQWRTDHLKDVRVHFISSPRCHRPHLPSWKPPLHRERKALFRSDGVLQSAPVILQPTQAAERQPATNEEDLCQWYHEERHAQRWGLLQQSAPRRLLGKRREDLFSRVQHLAPRVSAWRENSSSAPVPLCVCTSNLKVRLAQEHYGL